MLKNAGSRIGVALLTISLLGCGEGTDAKGPAGATPMPPPPPDLQKAFQRPGTKPAAPPAAPAKPDETKKG
jgi:hypothetical protein